jgi:hypothetical protein
MRVLTWTVAVFLVAGWAGAASGSPQHSVGKSLSDASLDPHGSKVASATTLFPTSVRAQGLAPTSARQRCFGKEATVSGSVGRDRIAGSVRRCVIVTGGGGDVVRHVGRNDLVCTGAGDDTVRSDHSQWGRIDLGSGDDRLEVAGAPRVLGGPGDDRLQVHGQASIDAGGGDDMLVSAAGGHL